MGCGVSEGLLEVIGALPGKRKGSAPEGEAWLEEAAVVNGMSWNFR